MSDEPARPRASVFVGGLTSAVTTITLHEAFIPFGPIVNISLPKPELPSNPDPHRGFGYVEFEVPQDAQEAIDNMDQSELFGRVIKVNLAKEQKAQGEGLGSKAAVWEQEGYLAKHAVSDEDRMGTAAADEPEEMDAMQGLEAMDVAGPRQA